MAGPDSQQLMMEVAADERERNEAKRNEDDGRPARILRDSHRYNTTERGDILGYPRILVVEQKKKEEMEKKREEARRIGRRQKEIELVDMGKLARRRKKSREACCYFTPIFVLFLEVSLEEEQMEEEAERLEEEDGLEEGKEKEARGESASSQYDRTKQYYKKKESFVMQRRRKRSTGGGRSKKTAVGDSTPQAPLSPLPPLTPPSSGNRSFDFSLSSLGLSSSDPPPRLINAGTATTPTTTRSFVKIVEKCAVCNGSGKINRQQINSALRTDDGLIHRFVDERGAEFYTHIRFHGEHLPLSETAETTLGRRCDSAEKILIALANEILPGKEVESIAAIITRILKRRPEIKAKVEENLKKNDPAVLDTTSVLPVLTKYTRSKNGIEKLTASLNSLAPYNIFGTREILRAQYESYNLNAHYINITKSVIREDETVFIPVAYVSNISEVMEKYAEKLSDYIYFADPNNKKFQLRIAADKGGEDTKLTLSFGNLRKSQSPYSQVVVAAYTGRDTNRNFADLIPEVFKQLNGLSALKWQDEDVDVEKFAIGDNRSLSALIGHDGQATQHPCVICPIQKKTMKTWDGQTDWSFWKTRSNCSGEEVRRASCTGVELLRVHSDNIVPPLLHDVTGPATSLLGYLIEDSAYADRCRMSKKPILLPEMPSQCGKSLETLRKEKHPQEKTLDSLRRSNGYTSHLFNHMKKENIVLQLYQGGILTGNHVKRFLSTIHKAVERFATTPQGTTSEKGDLQRLSNIYCMIGSTLRNIQSLTKTRRLQYEEQEALLLMSTKFAEMFALLPSMSITPKIHGIGAHFYPFFKKHGALGDFGEQFLESGHVHWNAVKNNSGMVNGSNKLACVMKSVNIRSMIMYGTSVDNADSDDE